MNAANFLGAVETDGWRIAEWLLFPGQTGRAVASAAHVSSTLDGPTSHHERLGVLVI
jgi:hypothetical protein